MHFRLVEAIIYFYIHNDQSILTNVGHGFGGYWLCFDQHWSHGCQRWSRFWRLLAMFWSTLVVRLPTLAKPVTSVGHLPAKALPIFGQAYFCVLLFWLVVVFLFFQVVAVTNRAIGKMAVVQISREADQFGNMTAPTTVNADFEVLVWHDVKG